MCLAGNTAPPRLASARVPNDDFPKYLALDEPLLDPSRSSQRRGTDQPPRALERRASPRSRSPLPRGLAGGQAALLPALQNGDAALLSGDGASAAVFLGHSCSELQS